MDNGYLSHTIPAHRTILQSLCSYKFPNRERTTFTSNHNRTVVINPTKSDSILFFQDLDLVSLE